MKCKFSLYATTSLVLITLSSVSMAQSTPTILSIEDLLAQKGVKPVEVAYDGNHPYIRMEVATAIRVNKIFDYTKVVVKDREECYANLTKSMVSEDQLRREISELSIQLSSVSDKVEKAKDISEMTSEEIKKENKRLFWSTLGKAGKKTLEIAGYIGLGYFIGSIGI